MPVLWTDALTLGRGVRNAGEMGKPGLSSLNNVEAVLDADITIGINAQCMKLGWICPMLPSIRQPGSRLCCQSDSEGILKDIEAKAQS